MNTQRPNTPAAPSLRPLHPLGVAILLSLALTACASMVFIPPPVAGPVEVAATRRGFTPASVIRGRETYIQRCADCHSLVPPDRHTDSEWDAILPRMTQKARLEPQPAADVRAYILATRESLTLSQPAPAPASASRAP